MAFLHIKKDCNLNIFQIGQTVTDEIDNREIKSRFFRERDLDLKYCAPVIYEWKPSLQCGTGTSLKRLLLYHRSDEDPLKEN
jgi:hypothetical protein